ncbi:SMC-Scp complex subunit ScpB [Luteimonas sp. RD2P54]|uniref:SMC-Scp complex subunit ScpB n=1 Tax=Luteimonas endophytica TaxID=3042023 RepID=A0ABT6J4A1_9GAMM|nr:SMC-Scp complex subunit ScpB [Luteimonas endophytica]MDH5821652.1 SMC-Scp complex subunit ScpB [Luteimonas endophytica]
MDQQLITRIVEAALLAASQPLTVVQLRGLFTLDEPAPEGAVEKALETLQAGCADRGIELVEVASGWRFQVAGEVHAWVARLWTERQTRYTRATLETLALIAYRQPITRGEIEQVRGVATNSNIIKALEEREWIRVVGHRDIPGRPELLGTTKAFLDYFGLKRLDELPPLSELKDFGELEPQFKFDPAEPDAEAMALGDLPAEDAADGTGEDPADIADVAETADAADASEGADAAGADVQAERDGLPGPAAASDGDPVTTQDDDTQRDALAADGDSERSTS